jgi:ABC-type dipeptide/oligopeptide/nickel transport system permease component
MTLLFLVRANLPHLPLSGWTSPGDIVAPVLLLALGGMGFYLRLMRTSMIEVLGQDYVRTARAKGLPERTVILSHALRNALIPLLTALGPALASTVTGLFFIEGAFQIPGIAFQTLSAIEGGDMSIIQATTNLATLAIVLLNLITDIVYGLVDPRIRVT